MANCQYCGGQLGVDCFNQSDCGWITQQQEAERLAHEAAQAYQHEIDEIYAELDAANAEIARLRAEAARLRQAQKENDQLRSLLATSSADCAYCGLPAKRMAECASGFPGCARADDMLFSATPTRDDLLQELAEARAEAARLRELIQDWHDNGEYDYRHPREVAIYNTAIASTTTTAEWLAARDAEQRMIGAAEELEKLGEWCRCGDVNPDDARDEIARACKNRAARLRKGE